MWSGSGRSAGTGPSELEQPLAGRFLIERHLVNLLSLLHSVKSSSHIAGTKHISHFLTAIDSHAWFNFTKSTRYCTSKIANSINGGYTSTSRNAVSSHKKHLKI